MSFCELWVAAAPTEQLPDDWLAPSEVRRLARVTHPAARQASRTGQVLLRLALARRLGTSPARVPLIRQCPHCDSREHGPLVAAGCGVTVSIAHTDTLVVAAISEADALGVDLERLPPTGTQISTATLDHALTPAERQRLAQLADHEQAAVFHKWWTRKESVLKAAGVGLLAPLTDVDLSHVTGSPFTISGPARYPGRPYWVSDIDLSRENAVAAVCVTVPPSTITTHNGDVVIREELHQWHRFG